MPKGLHKDFSNFSMLLAMFSVVFLPFIVIAFFNHPVGIHDWDLASFYALIDLPFFESQKYIYDNYTGRYMTTLVQRTIPYWFSINTFKAVPLVLFVAFFFTLSYFWQSFATKQGKTTFALLLITMFLVGLSGIFEMVYLLSGSLQYFMGCIFSLLWLSLLFSMFKQYSLSKMLILCLLTFMINGCNEINLLLLNIILGAAVLYTFILNKKEKKWLLIVLVVSVLSALLEVSAPSNFVRLEIGSSNGSKDILFAFLFSFPALAQSLISWFANTPIALITLLVWQPLLKVSARLNWEILEKKNIQWLSLLLFFSQWFPLFFLLFASGVGSLPERVIDVLYLHFLIGWLLLIIAIQKNYPALHKCQLPLTLKNGLVICTFIFILFNRITINRDIGVPAQLNVSTLSNYFDINNNVGTAYLDLMSNRASTYNTTCLENYKLLQTCNTDTCYINAPKNTPTTLYQKHFDRRYYPEGEYFMAWYFIKEFKRVKYKAPKD